MRRGEVWLASLPPPVGPRPVVLMSRDASYSVRSRATVLLVTSRIRGIRTEVRLGPSDGLKRVCVANADELLTVPHARLERRLAVLGPAKLAAIDDAVRFALALD